MKYLYLVLSLLLTAFIFSMSAETGEQSASLSLSIAQWAEGTLETVFPAWDVDPEVLHLVIRKAAHVTEYGVLGILYALTFLSFRLPLWAAVAAGFAVALADEASQFLSEGRGPSLVDALVFDFPGFLAGAGITGWLFQALKRKKRL